MKFSMLATLLAAAGIVAAAPASNGAIVKRSTDVIAHYAGYGDPFTYSFGECFPLNIDGAVITDGMVTRTAKCYLYTDSDCYTLASPAPLIVPADEDITNAADFTEIVAESANCYALP